MPNLYSQPIESKFMDTYVPIPFKEMSDAAAYKENRYDTATSAMNQLAGQVDNLQAMPGSPDEERMAAYQKAIHDLSNDYSKKDMSNSFVTSALMRDISAKINRSDINKILASKSAYDQAQKGIAELSMNNKWNPLVSDAPATWDSSKQGVYNWTPSAYMDKNEMFSKYFDRIQPQSQGIVDIGHGVAGLREAVTPQMVEQVARENAQMMVGTPQGQKYIRQWQIEHPGQNKDPYSILHDEMLSVGHQVVSSKDQVLPYKMQDLLGTSDQEEMPIAAVTYNSNEIAGKNQRQQLKTIDTNYKTALETVQNAERNPELKSTEAYNQAHGLVSRHNQIDHVAQEAAKKNVGYDEEAIKKQAFDKLRALKSMKNLSDAQLAELVNTQVGSGLHSQIQRLGTTFDNTADKLAYGVDWAGEFLGTALSTMVDISHPTRDIEAIKQAEANRDKTSPFTLGDIVGDFYGGMKNLWDKNKINYLTNNVDKATNEHDLNILRNLTKEVNQKQSAYNDEYKKQLLAQYNHINQKMSYFPFATTIDNSSGVAYVTNPEGKKVAASNIHNIVRNMSEIMDSGVEIKVKDDKGNFNTPGKNEKKLAKDVFNSWDLNTKMTGATPDKQGNIVFTFGLTNPKPDSKSGLKTSKTYEVKFPAESSMGKGIARDYWHGGQKEPAVRLQSASLLKEIDTHINDPEGHIYEHVTAPEGVPVPKLATKMIASDDPNTNGKYAVIINGYPFADSKGNVVPFTEEEATDRILDVQVHLYKAKSKGK